MEQNAVSYRFVEAGEREVFGQYLLPNIAGRVNEEEKGLVFIGAVWGDSACGAAAVKMPDTSRGEAEARLLSLFVDPLVRRRGVGEGLLRRAAETAADAGAAVLTARYAVENETMTALDALFRKLGAEPEFYLPVYVFDSAEFRDSRLLGRAFSTQYRRPEHITTFDALSDEQLAELEADPELLDIVDPARRIYHLPDLSLAYIMNGRVVGFWLGGETAPRHYTAQGVWHNSAAPLSCFHELLLAHIDLCLKRGGGDFVYYASPAVEYADRLIRKYAGERLHRLEEHSASLALTERRLRL